MCVCMYVGMYVRGCMRTHTHENCSRKKKRFPKQCDNSVGFVCQAQRDKIAVRWCGTRYGMKSHAAMPCEPMLGC